MSLNYLTQAGRHKLTRPYSGARAEQGANASKSKANLTRLHPFFRVVLEAHERQASLVLVPGVIS